MQIVKRSNLWVFVFLGVLTVIFITVFLQSINHPTRLADGTKLEFDGMAFGTNIYYADGKFKRAIRSAFPPGSLAWVGLGSRPALRALTSTLDIGLSWFGKPRIDLVPLIGSTTSVQLIDGDRTLVSQDVRFMGDDRWRAGIVRFDSKTPCEADELILRFVSGDVKTNGWVKVAEIIFKNPIRDQHAH